MILTKAAHLIATTGRVQVSKRTAQGAVPFYVFNGKPGFTFTLPPGRYKVQGGMFVGPMYRERPRKTANLRFPMPAKIRLAFGDNPNKATIDLRNGLILCDNSLRGLPTFALVFILFHEMGHYFFGNTPDGEKACDKFAADLMHVEGYNPSQIAAAASLSKMQGDRRCAVNSHALRFNNNFNYHGR